MSHEDTMYLAPRRAKQVAAHSAPRPQLHSCHVVAASLLKRRTAIACLDNAATELHKIMNAAVVYCICNSNACGLIRDASTQTNLSTFRHPMLLFNQGFVRTGACCRRLHSHKK